MSIMTSCAICAAFEPSVDDYLADCAERGVNPEKAASGNLMLRVGEKSTGAQSLLPKAPERASLNGRLRCSKKRCILDHAPRYARLRCKGAKDSSNRSATT